MKTKTTAENGFKETKIGLIPDDWDCTTLDNNELFEFTNGLWKGKKLPLVTVKVIRNTNFNNDGTLWLNDVAVLKVEEKLFKKRNLCEGDIILERSGGGPKQPVGRAVIFNIKDENYSFSNFTTRIRIKNIDRIRPKYLLYYLLHFYNKGGTYELQQRTTGIRNLNFTEYKKIKIPLLSLTEQQKIVSVLSKIQQSIKQQDKIIQTTKELKKSLMHKLFTEGLHGEEQKETEIGLMPKNWRVVDFVDCLSDNKIKVGKIKQQDFKPIGKYPVVDQGQKLIAGYSNDKSKVYRGDLPVIIFGDHTRILKYIDFLFICGADGTKVILPKKGLNAKFLFYALVNIEIPSRGYNRHYHLLKEKKIPVPLLQEQDEIVSTLTSIDKKNSQAESKKQVLQSLFKTMLNQLMTGIIRVKDLNIEVKN